MIRLASVGDAGELERLNAEFNGKGKTTEESIRASLLTNRREIVIVADGDGGRFAGFVCVQLKKIVLLRRIYARDNGGLCPSRVSRAGRRAGNADLRAGILQKNIPAPQLRAVDGQR